ncbi:MAG: hypothetical protein J6P47_01950, partial [Acetobacter sp.]|nr:hypothetical protein [Acetobacter sp.]
KKILFGSVVFVGLSIGSAQNSYAQIPVTDVQEHSETILQYILQGIQWLKQQIQYILQQAQHALQKMQYANTF